MSGRVAEKLRELCTYAIDGVRDTHGRSDWVDHVFGWIVESDGGMARGSEWVRPSVVGDRLNVIISALEDGGRP